MVFIRSTHPSQDTEAAVAALRATTSGGQSAVDQAGFIFMGFFGAGGAGNWSFSDTDGLVDWLQHDVALAQRNSTPGYGLPLSSTFQQASTGPSASTLRLLSGAYDSANLAELQTLNSRLHSIYYAITLLPNFTLTAQNLVALNDTIHSMLATGGVWDDFDAFFEHFDADYAALPDTALLTTHLDTLFAGTVSVWVESHKTHIYIPAPLVPNLDS
ncbi:hypothetical protein B484DRAFT_130750 [Ochromonadaceae sp. CCMP2298]|nr:hypothetical protein B484DRAFT_130750 [Ochromonadaceae sp. CCMP2298]